MHTDKMRARIIHCLCFADHVSNAMHTAVYASRPLDRDRHKCRPQACGRPWGWDAHCSEAAHFRTHENAHHKSMLWRDADDYYVHISLSTDAGKLSLSFSPCLLNSIKQIRWRGKGET